MNVLAKWAKFVYRLGLLAAALAAAWALVTVAQTFERSAHRARQPEAKSPCEVAPTASDGWVLIEPQIHQNPENAEYATLMVGDPKGLWTVLGGFARVDDCEAARGKRGVLAGAQPLSIGVNVFGNEMFKWSDRQAAAAWRTVCVPGSALALGMVTR